MGIWLLISSAAMAQDCVNEVRAEDLSELLASAEVAFSALELEAFTRHMDDAAFAVPCVRTPLSTQTVATYHRLQGLRQFVATNQERSVESFAAARYVEPDHVLPTTLVPDGHEVRQLYALFPLENAEFERVGEPVNGSLEFDGTPSLDRPTSWPTVVQVFDDAGLVQATAYLLPTDTLPPYEALRVDTPPLAAIPWIKTRKQLALLGSGLGVGLVGGALYGGAAVRAEDYNNSHPEWTEADLTTHERQTNSMVASSAVAGVSAVALVTSSFLVVTW